MAGMEASTITSLGTCRLVMPLSEFTIASSGCVSYTALMSASMAARSASGSFDKLRVKVAEAVIGIEADLLAAPPRASRRHP